MDNYIIGVMVVIMVIITFFFIVDTNKNVDYIKEHSDKCSTQSTNR